jgi:hypothetical protein
MTELTTIHAAAFIPGSRHTGPVYYGTGSFPYEAAIDGVCLRRKDGLSRLFKTRQAATRAIEQAQRQRHLELAGGRLWRTGGATPATVRAWCQDNRLKSQERRWVEAGYQAAKGA